MKQVPIQATPQQIEAVKNGATMFLLPIDVRTDITKQAWIDTLIPEYSPLQEGDEFFFQEEFAIDSRTNEIYYKGDIPDEAIGCFGIHKQDASQMTFSQSRIKGIVGKVEVRRLKDMLLSEYKSIYHYPLPSEPATEIKLEVTEQWFIDWYNAQYGENAYEKNPNVFSITRKEG